MNDQAFSYARKRGQTLLIVERNHEKNILFQLIFRIFPELSIRMDDVWIYGTNIYLLHNAIVKAYGNEMSRNAKTGFIWVLNTCIMLVADYNFRLLLS